MLWNTAFGVASILKACRSGFQTFISAGNASSRCFSVKLSPDCAAALCFFAFGMVFDLATTLLVKSHPAGAVPDNLVQRRHYTVALPSPSIAIGGRGNAGPRKSHGRG